jgi:hypothetical protein
MQLLQFAVPRAIGPICAEALSIKAGGATLINAYGWWVDGEGEIQREEVSWIVVGTPEDKVEEVVDTVKSILKSNGEKAIFYVVADKPQLEWL